MSQPHQATSQSGALFGSTGPSPTGVQPVGMAQTGPVHASEVSHIVMGASGGGLLLAIAGRTLRVGRYQFELHSISTEVDTAFDEVYCAVLHDQPLQWDPFVRVVTDLLRTNPSPSLMDKFFETAEPIAFVLIKNQRLEQACDYWRNILSAVTNAERAIRAKCHKGSGYFFWACSWFKRGDTDTGLLIMHEALVEDRRCQSCSSQIMPTWPNSSAAMVISLDKSLDYRHPASWWVDNQVDAIDQALRETSASLSANDIRSRLFLISDPETISLFIYSHSSLLRIESLNPDHRDNRFVGRLALGHLFQITVIIENLLKARSGNSGLFMAQIQELSSNIGGQLKMPIPSGNGSQYASHINNQIKSNANLLLSKLLDGTACYQDVNRTIVSAGDRPLCIAYALRNIGAHCIDAPAIIVEKLHLLRVQVLAVLAKCAEVYYP